MRICFLHIGVYKTGTSSIQWALHNQRAALAERGYLCPATGVVPALFGHHNIAAEITGTQSDPDLGGVDRLMEEIAASLHHVVLSCEDFTLAMYSRPRFQAFVDRLKRAGLSIVIVAYLRNTLDFLEAAYIQLLRTDFPFGFPEFIAAMVTGEALRWSGRSVGELGSIFEEIEHLSEDPDLRMVIRSYDVASRAIVADFFSVLGLAWSDFSDGTEPQLNPRPSVADAFALFFRNRMKRAPTESEARAISRLSDLPLSAVHMSEASARLTSAKFEQEDARLKARFGLDLSGRALKIVDQGPTLDEIFCEDTIHRIAADTEQVR
jgi:hypothetical protein